MAGEGPVVGCRRSLGVRCDRHPPKKRATQAELERGREGGRAGERQRGGDSETAHLGVGREPFDVLVELDQPAGLDPEHLGDLVWRLVRERRPQH